MLRPVDLPASPTSGSQWGKNDVADVARARVEYSHPVRAVLQRYQLMLADSVADLGEQESLRQLAFDYGSWASEVAHTLSPAEQYYLLAKVGEDLLDRKEWVM